ncbi:heparinase II/III family protein, partial [Rhizobium ruizarguesonis]
RDGINLSHDGYVRMFGVLHERELTLNAAGSIVTGRDRLVVRAGYEHDEPLKAVARCHSHPSIFLHQSDGESVLLTAPDGESWRCSAPGNEVRIAE